MKRDQEDIFQERFTDFRNIIKRSRTILAEQTIIDIYLITTLAIHIIISIARPAPSWTLSLICVFLLIARSFTVLFVRGNKGNCIGIGMAVVLFIMFTVAQEDFLFEQTILGVSVFLQIRRSYRIAAADKIKSIYGSPGFDGYLIYKEISKDPLLKKRVYEQITEASDTPQVRYALQCIHSDKTLTGLRVISAVAVVLGVAMLGKVVGKINSYEKAAIISNVSINNKGRYFKYTADRVYKEISVGTDSSTDSGFIVSVNGKCLLVGVPHNNKEQFKNLLEYYAKPSTAQLTGMDDFISDKSTAPSGEPLTFVAMVTDIKDTEKTSMENIIKRRDTNKMQFDIGSDEIITDYCLKCIDVSGMKKTRAAGAYIALFGTAGAVLTNVLFFRRKYEPEYLIAEKNEFQ